MNLYNLCDAAKLLLGETKQQQATAMAAIPIGGPRIKLNNGLTMPQVGLGTWKSKPGEVKAAVKSAVAIGYRHIDCAAIYKNEHEVGAALTELFDEGVVTRDEMWITSKLWNDFHDPAEVAKACAKTLTDLHIDFLDLYLIHWPVVTNSTAASYEEMQPSTADTWQAMEGLVRDGKCKSIGVSNFSAVKLRAMKTHAAIFPAVNQCELHPRLRQDALLAAAAELGTHMTAYSPLGSPDSMKMIGHDGQSVMALPEVQAIASEVSKTPAQVLIRWAVQRGTSVLPKSVTPERIAANLEVVDWQLSDAQIATLGAVEPQVRMLHGTFWCKKGPYKSLADLWDEAP